LARYCPEEGKSVLRGIAAFVETLLTRQTRRWQLALDGRDLSGNYLMVEVFSTRETGTRLKLAPKADPGDGLLDVVYIKEHDRENLLTFAKRSREGGGMIYVDVVSEALTVVLPKQLLERT